MIKLLGTNTFQQRSIFTMVFAASTMVFAFLTMVFVVSTMAFVVLTTVFVTLTLVYITLTTVFFVPTMVSVFSTMVFGDGKMFSSLDQPFPEAERILRTFEASFSITEKTAGERRR